jgi:hypothetical protein
MRRWFIRNIFLDLNQHLSNICTEENNLDVVDNANTTIMQEFCKDLLASHAGAVSV